MESKKLFYTMGEVSEMFDVSSSLIRYWESQFSVIKPVRNKKGNRLFTPKDVENFKLIYHLVKERGMTLEGAKKSIGAGKLPQSREVELMDRLLNMRSLLLEVREVLKDGSEEQVATPPKESAQEIDIDATIEVEPEEREQPTAPSSSDQTTPTQSASAEKELFAFYEQNLF